MQCARPREVLVDDLWDDYALRLMQRDYFQDPSQPGTPPTTAAKLAPPVSPPIQGGWGLFLSARRLAMRLTPFAGACLLALALWLAFFLSIAAFHFGVRNGETAAILRTETNR
jgi:hypothetical protein